MMYKLVRGAQMKKSKKSESEEVVREERIPFVMFTSELKAFDEARAKANPLAPRSKVIRMLIQRYAEAQGVPWPEEKQ